MNRAHFIISSETRGLSDFDRKTASSEARGKRHRGQPICQIEVRNPGDLDQLFALSHARIFKNLAQPMNSSESSCLRNLVLSIISSEAIDLKELGFH